MNPNAKVFIPLPSTCLRIEQSTGLPSKGGYFEKFMKVYKIIVSNISNPIRSKVLEAHHWPDKDVFIVPDLYANFCIGSYPDPQKDYQRAIFLFGNVKQSKFESKWLPSICQR